MRIEIYGIGTSAEADVFATSQIIKRPTNAVLAINVDMQVRSMDERWKKWQIKSMAIKIQCLMVFIWISLEQWVTVLFASLYHLEFDGAILFHSYNFKCVLHWNINDEFFPSLFPNDEHSRWKDTHRISEFASHSTHCLCMCACVSLWLPRNKNTHTYGNSNIIIMEFEWKKKEITLSREFLSSINSSFVDAIAHILICVSNFGIFGMRFRRKQNNQQQQQ